MGLPTAAAMRAGTLLLGVAALSRPSFGISLNTAGRRSEWQVEHEHEHDALVKLRLYTFEDFVMTFNRTYVKGSEEWEKRSAIFDNNMKDVVGFQETQNRNWSQGITKFMDHSPDEFSAVLGYRGGFRKTADARAFAQDRFAKHAPPIRLPANFSSLRGTQSPLSNLVRDQGGCGSCWAEAATAALEGQMEQHPEVMQEMLALLQSKDARGKFQTLSSQVIVSCTPNERHCGGTGGCGGSTVELAYTMVQERGLPLALDWPYESGFGSTPSCRTDVLTGPRLGITGYTVLPSNKQQPLLEALVKTGGAVAVSADASRWSFYVSGVFSDATRPSGGDFTVNHAVTLVGFTLPTADALGYYLVKNSWGSAWGENGFIRVQMTENEDEHCGWDYSTHDGLACDGDPDQAWVCGTSGILYDSVYPTGLYVVNEQANATNQTSEDRHFPNNSVRIYGGRAKHDTPK